MGLHRRCRGVRTETEGLTVRYNIFGKIMVREAPLQAERLQPGHGSANSQVGSEDRDRKTEENGVCHAHVLPRHGASFASKR